MQVTPEHHDAAMALGHLVVPNREDRGTVAGQSFLSAVERIDVKGWVRWTDSTLDDGQAYVMRTTEKVTLALESDGEGTVHIFTPDEAEARGWELIALAHLARTSPSIASGSEG